MDSYHLTAKIGKKGKAAVNGSAYREIEVALPRELTHSQRLELVQEFIEQELGDKHA